jgi:hypothetical protein
MCYVYPFTAIVALCRPPLRATLDSSLRARDLDIHHYLLPSLESQTELLCQCGVTREGLLAVPRGCVGRALRYHHRERESLEQAKALECEHSDVLGWEVGQDGRKHDFRVD